MGSCSWVRLVLWLLAWLLIWDSLPAGAQIQFGSDPVLFGADELVYDRQRAQITASGHVELSQGPHLLYADILVYDQQTGRVEAQGNLRIYSRLGSNEVVVLAQRAEFTKDEGWIDRPQVLFGEHGPRLIAAQARRRGGRFTDLYQAAYTSCQTCQGEPLWQLRAARVVYDEQQQEVRYQDMVVRLGGIPMLYLPYFAHPDPRVEQRSGILPPRVGLDSTLGVFATARYYLVLAPNVDATAQVTAFSGENPLVGLEWRHWSTPRAISLRGSVVQSRQSSDDPDLPATRGFVVARGATSLGDSWRAGGQLGWLSDVDFARHYLDGQRLDSELENYLISHLFATRSWEGWVGERHLTQVEGHRFRSLLSDNRLEDEPWLAKWRHLAYRIPLAGGQAGLAVEGRHLWRERGVSSQLVSFQTDWQRWAANSLGWGLSWELDLSLRGDVWFISNGQDGSSTRRVSRLLPQGQLKLGYPWVRPTGDQRPGARYWLIEPMVGFTLAPAAKRILRGQNAVVPNEDSPAIDLDPLALFSNRYSAGADRTRGSPRVAYGVLLGWYGSEMAEVTFGQQHRWSRSGTLNRELESRTSSLLTSLSIDLDSVELAYDASLRQGARAERESLQVRVGGPALSLQVDYNRREREADGRYQELSTLSWGVSSQVSSRWSTSLRQEYEFAPSRGSRKVSWGIGYQDECFVFEGAVARQYADSIDDDDGITFSIRFGLRDIGALAASLDAF